MEKNGKNGNEKVAVKYVCKYCLYECSKQSDYNKHLTTLKHARNQQNFQNGNKTRQTIFTCQCGNEYKGRDGLWKHQKTCIGNQNVENSPKNGNEKLAEYFVCVCGKKYKNASGLWKHHKKCIGKNGNNPFPIQLSCQCGKTFNNNETYILHINNCATYKYNLMKNNNNVSTSNVNNNNTNNNTNVNTNVNTNTNDIMKLMMDTFTQMTNASKEKETDFKELVIMMLKENKELQKGMMEIIPQINGSTCNTNSNNTYHTNNISNNFNIQMFLNERCKNAMNLTDFIQSLPITAETYDNTIQNGLTKTITSMFVDGLNNMDILERPIHCTDPARKTLYIKDNDVWEKDNELKKIESGITEIALKQRTMINKWQDANEGWDKNENLQTKLTTLVFHSMSDVENDEKETGKIIRAISKHTYLNNDIKNEYKITK